MSGLLVLQWLPESVAHQARMLHQQAIDATEAALVQRLASDPRMQAVWAEVAKHQLQNYEPTGRHLHPATVPPWAADPGDVVACQAVAAGLLFHFAIMFRRFGGARAIPARNWENPSWVIENPYIDFDDPLVVERNRGDAEARGLAICLVEKCRELFPMATQNRSPRFRKDRTPFRPDRTGMYRTVATIASVVLERTIPARAVRQWSDTQADKNAYPHSRKTRSRA
jgi:hypothetical protein